VHSYWAEIVDENWVSQHKDNGTRHKARVVAKGDFVAEKIHGIHGSMVLEIIISWVLSSMV
jgi:hypothetical protein